jgi:ribonuclease HI
MLGEGIAVCVGGSCLGNGKSWAKAGLGVYFGPGSQHNKSEPLEYGQQTNQRAEINAAIIAIRQVKDLLDYDELDTRLVVLVTDSKYVVECMTQHIYKWRSNGWISAKGYEVANKADFQELDDLIDELRSWPFDCSVKFWWVPKRFNKEADQLARNAAGY